MKPFRNLQPWMITCEGARFFSNLVDVLFPPVCIACGALLTLEDSFPFCAGCRSQVRFIRPPFCTVCGRPHRVAGDSLHLCGECTTAKPPYSAARACGTYDSTLMDVIHLFKYQGKIQVGEVLGKLMATWKYSAFDITDYEMVVPVPLHPDKLRERGFNQSQILAKEIAKRCSISHNFTALTRENNIKPQVGLGKSERRANVRGAFRVADQKKLRNKRILLVDDVYTTGSTVRECARVLMKGGARDVAVLTLARA